MATSHLLEGYIDYKGNQITIPNSNGGWKSAILVLGAEIADGFAYYGICSNLINYLTGSLHVSTANAAEMVNLFVGVSCVLPVIGAFVADSFLGRYKTIVVSTILASTALLLISLSAGIPSLHPPNCKQVNKLNISCDGPSLLHSLLFFFPLYLFALGRGCFKPSAQAFGADQFDATDPKGRRSRSSFFTWLYFGISVGGTIGVTSISYSQEQVGWGIGFGVPCICMLCGLLVFLLGRRGYRYGLKRDGEPLTWLLKDMVVVTCKWFKPSSSSSNGRSDYGVDETTLLENTNQSKSAMLEAQWDSLKDKPMEEAKAVLCLLPIWATSLIYSLATAQQTTFFIKQGTTMDRRIFSSHQIPATTLQSLVGLAVLLSVPVYDRILVPVARRFTGITSGITMLQRIGTGLFLSMCSMVVAALVEMRRIRIARESGLIDLPNVMVPMSAWWLLPQIILIDLSGVFAIVGLQEFFYDQIPSELQSVGISLFFTYIGFGNFLSSFFVFLVDKMSKKIEGASWLSDNLNKAHLDYLYLLLAGLSILEFGVFLILARCYRYRNGST